MLKAMFVYNFDSGVNFCGENIFAGTFFRGNFFCGSSKNTSLCRDKNLTHMFTLARQVQMPESRDMSSFWMKIGVKCSTQCL